MATNTAATRTHPRLAVQAFWLTFAKFLAAVFGIATPILLVRILNQHEYGVYKQVFLFAGTATNLAAFSVGVSAFYYMPRQPQRGGQIALNILVYNFIVGLIPLLLLIFYPQFLNLFFRSGDLQPYALMLGIFVMLLLNSSLVEMIPTAMQDVRNSTVFVVGTQLFKAVAVVLAAIAFRTVRSIVMACIIAAALSGAILLHYLYRRFGAFWKHFDPHFFIEQLAYALPLGAYGIIWVIRKDLDNYFVSAMYPPAQYAIYAIGWLEVPLITLFAESMLAVMVVRISALHKEGRAEDIRHVLASAINRLATVQFAIYALLLVAGRDLIVFFYTKAYAASAPIFYITITLIVLNVFIYDPVVRAYIELRKFILLVRIGVLVALVHRACPGHLEIWDDWRGGDSSARRPGGTADRRLESLPDHWGDSATTFRYCRPWCAWPAWLPSRHWWPTACAAPSQPSRSSCAWRSPVLASPWFTLPASISGGCRDGRSSAKTACSASCGPPERGCGERHRERSTGLLFARCAIPFHWCHPK